MRRLQALLLICLLALAVLLAGCQGGTGLLGPGLSVRIDKSVNVYPGFGNPDTPGGEEVVGTTGEAGSGQLLHAGEQPTQPAAAAPTTNAGNRGYVLIHYQTDSQQDVTSTIETINELRELLQIPVSATGGP